jgi:hypothetical protein
VHVLAHITRLEAMHDALACARLVENGRKGLCACSTDSASESRLTTLAVAHDASIGGRT